MSNDSMIWLPEVTGSAWRTDAGPAVGIGSDHTLEVSVQSE